VKKDIYIKRQSGLLTARQIDRRSFIMSALAAGVALPAALGLADTAMAQTPKSGGRLRIGTGYGSTTDTLNPATFENGMTLLYGYSFGNNLTETDNTGNLVGELAESFEPSNGAATWTFKLRSGVTFHNGKSLTADDVIATMNFHRAEDSTSAAKGLLTAVTDIRKDDDLTVVFDLQAGNADFPSVVSDYHLIILPSVDGVVDATSGVGTGGYSITSFEPGVRVLTTRNPNYWKEGRGHFDEFEILSLVDTTARQNAVMNGDVDFADSMDPKTVSLLGRAPNLTILETSGTQHYTAPMRLNVEPFGNYDLRMALKLAIKRQELVDKILLGHGVAGNDIPVNASMPFFDASIAQREFDPEKAKFHYDKSGHSGKVQLSASDAAFAGAVDAAQLIAASAAEAGIEIEVVREPTDGYWSNVWNKKGWCMSYWGGRPTQDWMYSAAYTADTEWNETAWVGTDGANRFNELALAARSETDPAKRQEQYSECQALIQDDSGAIIPMWANYIHAHSKELAHDEAVAANWESDGSKVMERWWFA
jgi:peptide/nickel transport system substrate-binding protein